MGDARVALVLALAVLAAPADARAQAPQWRSAWAASLWRIDELSTPATSYRVIMRADASGDALRLRLANGSSSGVSFQHAGVAIRAAGPALVSGTLREVTFGGRREVTLEPGERHVSDPVELPLRRGDDLAVTLYAAAATELTVHRDSFAASTWGVTQYASAPGAGDATADTAGEGFREAGTDVRWVDAVEVLGPPGPAIVALGDSLTDGAGTAAGFGNSRIDAYDRYPDALARRLAARPPAAGPASVINEGKSGDGLGGVAERLQRDVLSQRAAATVIVCIGSNDLLAGRPAAEVIGGLGPLAARLRKHGLRVVAGAIPPRSPLFTARMESFRRDVNAWIRSTPVFDAVADFDAALRDPAHPEQIDPRYSWGDGSHPNAAGYEAMAAAVHLETLVASVTPAGPLDRGETLGTVATSLRLTVTGARARISARGLARRGLRIAVRAQPDAAVEAFVVREHGRAALARAYGRAAPRARLTLRLSRAGARSSRRLRLVVVARSDSGAVTTAERSIVVTPRRARAPGRRSPSRRESHRASDPGRGSPG